MASDALIGTQIGEFTVNEVIGRGGMATVYRASQPLMHRDVALKVISMAEVTDKNRDWAERFATEAKLIASLEHPNILPVYSYGFSDNFAYLAMRLLRGGSLEDLMYSEHGEPLPTAQAISLFNQIALGLAHAHSKGILHRDMKPSNILLDDDGHVYLTDFGLAKLIDSDAGVTKTGQIMGTPVYMSPEQLRGETLDFRSDVYALGCILYEILTGAPPFPPVEGDVIPVIFNHLQTPPAAPTTRSSVLPPALDAVVLKALAKSPTDRYGSVRELATAVQEAVGQLSTVSFPRPADVIVNRTRPVAVPPATEPLQRPAQPRTMLYAGGAVLAVVLAVVLFFALRGSGVKAIPQFTASQVLRDEEGAIDAIVPTADEIAIAQQALGSDGFIALIPCNMASEYHTALVRELSSFAREKGLATRIYDADSDKYKQLTLIERAVAENARGIVLCPLDIELLDATMDGVRRARIPFVTQAAGMGDYGGVQILIDNTLLGRAPGEYIGQVIRDEMGGEANVVVLAYDDLPDVVRRADGMIAGMLEYAPDANIVARVTGGTVEAGRQAIEQLLADGVEFNVILSINDVGASGAVDALDAAGVPHDAVIIAGVDAEVLAQRYIREGRYFRVSVEAGRTVYASAAVDVLIKLLAGVSIPEFIFIPPGELVTRESLSAP